MFYTIAVGYLGQDAKINHTTNNNKSAINFSIAHTEKYQDKEVTTWIECTLWREADKAAVMQYLKKGSRVIVRGPVKAKAYQNGAGELVASLQLTVEELTLC